MPGGKPAKRLTSELLVSEKTVEEHLSRVFDKLGVNSRTELAAEWEQMADSRQ